jgi:hypothetical protein
MPVEVFKTDVRKKADANRIMKALTCVLNGCRVSFDLHDCDKILRIEAYNKSVCVQEVIDHLHENGFSCELLD